MTAATEAVEDVDSTGEQWRPIEGYGGLYSVSTLGRVRSEADGEADSSYRYVLMPVRFAS